MNTYWDLSETERAALSSEDVQKYVDAELMLKGVLKVKPLELEPVPTAPDPATKAFVVRFAGKYGRADAGVAFTTIEAAQAFIALRPMALQNEYFGSTPVAFTQHVADPEIAEVAIYTEEAKNAASVEVKRAAAIRDANDKRTREYETATRAQETALKGLWEDWSECRDAEAKLRAVADTFADYERTAGDKTIAANFLAKVYPATLIAEASARFGFPAPAPEAAT